MGVVLGLIAVSFAIWGIGDIFRGFGRSSLARIGGTEITDRAIPPALQRAAAAARPPARPPDHAGPGARSIGLDQQLVGQLIGEATIDERVKALRLGISDAEMARRITTNPELLGPTGQFDRLRFEMMLRSNQIHRAALHRRAAPPDVAAAIGRHRAHRNAAAEGRDRSRRALSATSSAPSNTSCSSRAQAGEIPDPTPERAREVFRGAQGAVPRARVSQDRRPAALARRAGDVDRRSPMRTCSAPMTSAARAISRPSAGRCSRSSSTIRRRRRRRPTASPRANRSSTSPRSASSPKRTSISAR